MCSRSSQLNIRMKFLKPLDAGRYLWSERACWRIRPFHSTYQPPGTWQIPVLDAVRALHPRFIKSPFVAAVGAEVTAYQLGHLPYLPTKWRCLVASTTIKTMQTFQMPSLATCQYVDKYFSLKSINSRLILLF